MDRVEWLQVALDELTTPWMQCEATRRMEITAASREIDRRLGRAPRNEGESRSGGRRAHSSLP